MIENNLRLVNEDLKAKLLSCIGAHKRTRRNLLQLLDEEIEFAKGTNMPQFVLGLQQAKKIIEGYKFEGEE